MIKARTRSLAGILVLIILTSQVLAGISYIKVLADDNVPYTIENPSFETGDLTGWTVLEGEAFGDYSVSSDKTWWAEQIPYNHEGEYHLNGWRKSEDISESNEAATGRMRSSTFRLGGSGWITFRLGGGKNVNLVHIKIRDAETDEILAIYGNTEFSEENFPNVEAGMRLANMELYRADLSPYIGRTLYIEIVDNATHDWGLIFADAFHTYHEEVPTEGVIAKNFLILNPGFETGNLSGWTVVEGGAFGPNSVSDETTWWTEQIPYNQEGKYHLNGWRYPESEKGKLRSSTFRLAGCGWITFKLGGGGNPNEVYIEVYDAEKNELIAVFANTEFADINFPNIDQGMRLANMVQYRADLSDFIGRDLYIQIVDDATEYWGLIFADAFFTYYETIPEEGVIAQNRYIPPEKVSKYGIKNPDFETGDFEGWEVEGETFVVTNDAIDIVKARNQFYAVSNADKTGSIKSINFEIGNAARLEFLIGGDIDFENLYVALVDADTGEIIKKVTPFSDTFEIVIWDLKDYIGRNAYIIVVDNSNSGFIMVDGFEVNKGLVAYWSFDEMAGKYAKDSVTNKKDYINYTFNNAVYKPSTDPQWKDIGIRNGTLLFDGYSTWIERDASEFEEISDELTIEAWVAPRSYEWGDGGKLSAIVNQHSKSKREGFILGMYRHGTWSFQIGVGNRWIEVWSEEKVLEKNKWSHVAATFDKNTATARIYLNGELVAEEQTPANMPINPSNAKLMIGKNNEAVKLNGVFDFNMFNGLIDELKIYNRVLTEDEIRKNFNQDLAAYNGSIPEIDYENIALDPKVYDGDRYRPQYHAIPPGHWMNEPHAPFYFNGKYHLFYQHNPQGPFWHQIHWGHWVSDDLVHWEHMPIALSPEKGDITPDGVWAGSATYDADGNPVLLFTAGNDSKSPNQAVGLAFPKDLSDPYLKEWEIYPQLVNEQKPGMGRLGEFRDNFTWKDGDKWYQIITSGSTITGSGTALVYVSDDLYNWEYKGELYQADISKYPYIGTVWELPVLLPIKDQEGNEKYIFTVLPAGDNKDVEIFYWIGEFDKVNCRFIPDHEEPKLMDLGDSYFTGGAGMVDPKTGRTIFFTISQLVFGTGGNQFYYDLGWAHNAGLPVSLSLGDDGELRIEPIEELASLRGEQLVSFTGKNLNEANELIKDIKGDTLEIELEIEPQDAEKFGIIVRRSPNGEEETLLYYNNDNKTFSVDRNKTTLNPDLKNNYCYGVQGGKVDLKGENLKLRIFLDRSMLEVYINNRKSLTTRVFPSRGDSMGLQIWADGNITVKSMKVWRMKSAYGDGTIVPPYWPESSVPENTGSLLNHDFETGDLTGWTVVEGNAFTDEHVTNVKTFWGGPFNHAGEYHLWGFNESLGGDSLTGVLKSHNFILGGDGQINLLVAGGNDIDKLYVALVRASDGKELFKATGGNTEQYFRVRWDASEYIGEELYIKVVDNHTGGFGHINIDDVNVPVELEPLVIEGVPSKLEVGQKVQIKVIAVTDSQLSRDVTSECIFHVSDSGIADVNNTGLLTAQKKGITLLEVIYNGPQGIQRGEIRIVVDGKGSGSGHSDTGSGVSEQQTTNESASIIVSDKREIKLYIEEITTDKEGEKTVSTVKLDEDIMEQAITILKTADNKVITIKVAKDCDIAEVSLPLNSVLKTQSEIPDCIINIVCIHGSYKLPVNALDISTVLNKLGVPADQCSIRISIGLSEVEMEKEVGRVAEKLGVNIVSELINFDIFVEAKDRSERIEHLGNAYVERNIYLNKAIDSKKATAAAYDPETNDLCFVPAVIETKDGITVVTIRRNCNSIYMMVESTLSFKDTVSHWAEDEIELLARKLIARGDGKGMYYPYDKITRAEFTELVVRALGLKKGNPQRIFKDVDENSWYASAVQKAYEIKIISGYGDGTFRPNAYISRQEMAAVIIRALEYTGAAVTVENEVAGLLSRFKDYNDIGVWAREAVAKAVKTSIFHGKSDGRFAPDDTATRAEAAVVIIKLLKYLNFIN